jgi:murein DD-endopeptidase MepM/ murein hydrolase activator NlpD
MATRPIAATATMLVLLATSSPRLATAAEGPSAEPPPPQTTHLSLPFTGVWGIIQGFESGDTHVGYAAYALDFVPAQPAGTRAPRRGAALTRFACYGRPVLAPADGTVVVAHGGARDWPAYTKGRDQGNYVILEHAPGEYTEFRHLAARSVRAHVGDRLHRGDLVGRCGNSGNATTPHLHVGFLSSIDPITTRLMTLSGYEVMNVDGTWHQGDGTPRKGEILRPFAD